VSAIYDSFNYENMNICQRLHYHSQTRYVAPSTPGNMSLFSFSAPLCPTYNSTTGPTTWSFMAKISKDSNTKATIRNVKKLILVCLNRDYFS
jgi:hypothetical protein